MKRNHHVGDSLNARLLHAVDKVMDRIYGSRKRSIYGGLPGLVVEIGPGAGANFRYYAPGTTVIAIEPNPAMHPHMESKARHRHLNLQIKAIKGESIDLPDQCTSAVVGTLVLCTVDRPQQVVSEILRILKPGGRYIFLEHVAAMPGTRLRGLQEHLLKAWQWLFDGCHLNRNSQQVILDAGFTKVDIDCFVMQTRWLPFSPHIFGTAHK